jgi:hypothetical protein
LPARLVSRKLILALAAPLARRSVERSIVAVLPAAGSAIGAARQA